MFTIDKKEYRNLQEQVLKNKEDIAAHYAIDRVLAQFGIRVIGVVATYDDLIEQHGDYEGEYGDAFAVGTEPPYVFYIWTRPDPAAGHETAYWFNVGELAIVGPQGIPGASITNAALNNDNQLVFTFSDGRVITIPRSLKGEPGGSPSITLTSTGEGVTIKVFNPEGALEQSAIVRNGTNGQSIQGPPGPPSPAVVFKGIITSISQLDGVIAETPNDAYLLDDGTTDRYIVGLVNGSWTNLGLFTGGTVITAGNVIQNEWNADTKLDKVTEVSRYRRVYGISPNSTETRYLLLDSAIASSPSLQIVCRDSSGQVTVPLTPTNNTDAASKSYVDSKQKQLYNIFCEAQIGEEYTIYFQYVSTSQSLDDLLNIESSIPCTGYNNAYNYKTPMSFQYLGNSAVLNVKVYDETQQIIFNEPIQDQFNLVNFSVKAI